MPEFTSTGTEYIDEFFAHHGIKGQKWGIRRYQNPDGSLTERGKKRYGTKANFEDAMAKKKARSEKRKMIAKKVAAETAKTALRIAIPAGMSYIGYNIATEIMRNVKKSDMMSALKTIGSSAAAKNAATFSLGANGETIVENILPENIITEKILKQSEFEGPRISFSDIQTMVSDDALEHSGILGMKWGLRRFQNPDGSLTEAGRKRYAKSLGGAKTISEKEKERAKKAKWASDPKSLYKRRNEFTKDELDKAMETFSSQNKLKQQIEADKEYERRAKEARRKAKADYKKAKLDYKRLQLQEKLDKAQAEERYKQQKLETEQKKMANKQKQETAEASTKADIWRNRVSKLQSVLGYAKEGKKILDDMGITGGESGESLFGALAESMGLKDTSAAKAKKQAKEQREKDKADLELRKLVAQVKSAEIGAKQAEYNLKHPGKGGKGVDTDKLAQDIIDELRNQGVL